MSVYTLLYSPPMTSCPLARCNMPDDLFFKLYFILTFLVTLLTNGCSLRCVFSDVLRYHNCGLTTSQIYFALQYCSQATFRSLRNFYSVVQLDFSPEEVWGLKPLFHFAVVSELFGFLLDSLAKRTSYALILCLIVYPFRCCCNLSFSSKVPRSILFFWYRIDFCIQLVVLSRHLETILKHFLIAYYLLPEFEVRQRWQKEARRPSGRLHQDLYAAATFGSPGTKVSFPVIVSMCQREYELVLQYNEAKLYSLSSEY